LILLDTTILVYAVGGQHALRGSCRRVLALAQEAAVRATTTTQVVQEFAHVRARRSSRSEAAGLARAFATGLGPLVRPDFDDLAEGLALFEEIVQLGAFDAVLAATARRRRWALASADRAFAIVGGLVHIDPASPRFLEEAGAVD
jgi:predicted nucleic acid-binding protein